MAEENETEDVAAADDQSRAMVRRAAQAGLAGGLLGVVVGSWLGFSGLVGDGALLGGIAGALFGVGLIAMMFALRGTHEILRLSDRVRDLSEVDQLTGLGNGVVLRRHLEEVIESARDEHTRTALLVIGVGELEQINSSHGREIGDEVVEAVVARIRTVLRPGDQLFRADGTHFALVAEDIGPVVTADRLAEAIIDPLNAAYEFDNELIPAPAVIGVAVSDDQGTVVDDLLADAAAAIHKASTLGAGSIVRFEQSLVERNLTPATAHHRLEKALERGEFHLVYMPMRDTATAKVVGVEALLRWTDEQRGVVAAADFMEAMEQTGLIVPVGEWVLQEACRQATYWARTFPSNGTIPVTVNLSTRQVVQRDFVDRLNVALDAGETDPRLLTLEVREQTLLTDREGPWTALRAAKDTGVRLSLDNFGRGSSSISTLLKLRLDQLKIDRSFIEAMDLSSEDRAVVRHLVALAGDLGLTTVGEGVSSREQVAVLAELGCDQVQGHFAGKPASAGAIDELLYKDLTKSPTPPVKPAEEPPPASSAPIVEIAPPEPTLVGAGGGLPTRTPGATGAGPTVRPTVREAEPAVVPAEKIRRRVNPRRADLFGR